MFIMFFFHVFIIISKNAFARHVLFSHFRIHSFLMIGKSSAVMWHSYSNCVHFDFAANVELFGGLW